MTCCTGPATFTSPSLEMQIPTQAGTQRRNRQTPPRRPMMGVMYYGGGPSSNKDHCQVNVATSSDGVHFTRIRDPNGLSQIFLGPGWARDPMVLRIGEQYFNYYCADEEGKGVICLRTSPNSTGAPWSEYEVVSEGGILGAHRSSQQCPFVVHIDMVASRFARMRRRGVVLAR